MSSNWIQYEKATPAKPEVFLISAATGLSVDAVIGKLMRFWSWVDDLTENGIIPGLPASIALQVVDTVVGHDGFAEALVECKWFRVDTPSPMIPNCNRHTGDSAKRRAMNAERQRRFRKNKGSSVTVTPATSLPEERKGEEENTPPAPEKTEYTKEFETWWEMYPKKRGKGAASKSFTKAKKRTPISAIMRATEIQVQNWLQMKKEMQYIPNPTTWLNQSRWDDEPESEDESRLESESPIRFLYHTASGAITGRTLPDNQAVTDFIKEHSLTRQFAGGPWHEPKEVKNES